jgi:hypothetical protein
MSYDRQGGLDAIRRNKRLVLEVAIGVSYHDIVDHSPYALEHFAPLVGCEQADKLTTIDWLAIAYF